MNGPSGDPPHSPARSVRCSDASAEGMASTLPAGRALDRRMLDLAARAAWRGFGLVEPNPMVGCVLMREGSDGSTRVVGIGHHGRFGGLHAEREALADCARRGEPGAARGATAYVTLEPCNGHGKQPPCVQALVEAGIAKVVFAESDPSENKRGGSNAFAAVGIPSRRSDASPWASRVSAPWRKHLRTGLPWVVVKWAQTIDGRVATGSGDSKWISAEPSRRAVHALRGRVDAVLTGVGTVIADDPLLDCRFATARRVALRVVVDSSLRTPLDSRLARSAWERASSAGEVVVATAHEADRREPARSEALRRAGVRVWIDPQDAPNARGGVRLEPLLRWLGSPAADGGRGVQTVLVEAGPRLVGSLLREGLVDEIVAFTAPFVLPDAAARPASEPIPTLAPLATIAQGRALGTFRAGLARRVAGTDDLLCSWWRDPG